MDNILIIFVVPQFIDLWGFFFIFPYAMLPTI